MKIVAITRILNEADIVEAFTRHAAALVDHHVFLDNGSTDATLKILSALAGEGISLEVHRSDAVTFAESDQNNFLFHHAVERCGADWVMPLDADEFLDGDKEKLRPILAETQSDAIKVRVREYQPSPDHRSSDLLIPARIIHARAPSEHNLKVIVRGSLLKRGGDLLPGAHGVKAGGDYVDGPVSPDFVYAHYAVRSPWQWIAKFVMGWSKVLAAGPAMVAAGTSGHYRAPFELLARDPGLILRSPYFMEFRQNDVVLFLAPLRYFGEPLRYTAQLDYEMCAVQSLMTHLDRLSRSHGALCEAAKRLGSGLD